MLPPNSPCPFCGLRFRRLGPHLPSCNERNGRDYSGFLVSRPARSRPARGSCPKCGRHFKRLDTHLRVSATCREVVDPAPTTTSPALPTMNTIPSTTAPTADVATSAHHFKQPLRLPKTAEEWDEANTILSVVTSATLQAISAEEKSTCLCAGIYDLMASRFGARPFKSQHPKRSRVKQHDRALKKVTQLKNEVRWALRRAWKCDESVSTIQPLAAKFLSLLRDHSRLKRASARRLHQKDAKIGREECHRNFWRYAKGLLDGKATSQTTPEFSATTAHTFFSDVYKSAPHQFQTPPWMPAPPPPGPGKAMDMSPISAEELSRVIRKSRSSSAPSPYDHIPYIILKRCPSLQPALLDLYNRVIMEGRIPSAWKVAGVKLIPKSSAGDDPSAPGNFRPIALTPTIAKLLSGILKDRWLRHMRSNNYLNSDLQKAFLPTIPGVAEHQAKLAATIKAARRNKRSLAIAWLDIANAYGSVHHSLIQFSLAHYHAPPEFCTLMQSMYTGLSATISTDEWCTAPVPLGIGVYQGDP